MFPSSALVMVYSSGQSAEWASSPDYSGGDLRTEKDAQITDSLWGKHANDGECHMEVRLQSFWLYRELKGREGERENEKERERELNKETTLIC